MLGKKNIINTNNSNIATFFILNTSNEKLSQEWDELECVWVCFLSLLPVQKRTVFRFTSFSLNVR